MVKSSTIGISTNAQPYLLNNQVCQIEYPTNTNDYLWSCYYRIPLLHLRLSLHSFRMPLLVTIGSIQ